MGSIGSKVALIPVVEIKNISNQILPFNIKKVNTSMIYKAAGGTVPLAPAATVVVEQNRVDIRQLTKLSNLKLINYQQYNQSVNAGLTSES